MSNALISANLLPRGRAIIAIKLLFKESLFFFLTFHFVNKALTYCIRPVLLWCVYLKLSSWWLATEWRRWVATSFTTAAKPQETGPVSTVTQCFHKQLLVWSPISMARRHLWLQVLVQRRVAQRLPGLKREGAQNIPCERASADRGWKWAKESRT